MLTTKARLRKAAFAIVWVLALVMIAACDKQERGDRTPAAGVAESPAPAASSAPAATGDAQITFKWDPETPQKGDNTVEVLVTQGGKPVDDAQVFVEMYMAAMPEMNHADMRTKAILAPLGDGIYRGGAEVMMAGTWDVTVRAVRNGQEIGSRKMTIAPR
jgi:nitrogen fixation protein FixH